ncbi:MAG: carboxypeptidase regulatory-like domain-containing protein [Verrucomicrobiaceae bacterium]|nr:carboxypeptidase regulatory-like domain-containing protein [Verrucomicrobiaceae bacterium]
MKCLSHAALLAVSLTSASLRAQQTAQPDTKPVPTRQVTVRVVDAAGGFISGARIHRSVWSDSKFPPNADFDTELNGEAVFDVPEDATILRLWASKAEHVPMFANFDARELKEGIIPVEYTFTLVKGTRIGGVVRDEKGAPIAGAKVEVSVDSRDTGGKGEAVVNRWLAEGKASVTTDAQGRWTLTNAPAGDHWEIGVRLRHAGHISDAEWRTTRRGATHTLAQLRALEASFVMESGVRISGTVNGPDGGPVARALVIWGDRPYHNTHEQEVFTNDQGRYELPAQPPGPNLLTIVAQGFAPQLKAVDFSKTGQVEDFQLAKGKTVTFRFVDQDGQPVPKAAVNITGWREHETLFNWRHSNVPYSKIPDRADDNGIYTWTWAPDDPVEYLLGQKGYKEVRGMSFEPGTHTITLRRP